MRNRTISIRVTDREYEEIQNKIKATGQTQQAFVLNAIDGATISTAEDKEQLKAINLQLADLLKQIKGIAVNINQMAYRANAYRELPTVQKLDDCRKQNERLRKESKIHDSLVYVSGPFDGDVINYDTVYRSFLSEKKLWDKDSGRMYAHNIIS